MHSKSKGAIIAAVVASLFATTAVAASSDTEATIKCMGINNCKSMGGCKAGASNNCGGKNSCKSLNSKSIVTNLTAKECEDHGGTVVK
jgi:hypothetical protein